MKNPAFHRGVRASLSRLRLVEHASPTDGQPPPVSPGEALVAFDEWCTRPIGDWSSHAACRGLPTDLFFPEGSESEVAEKTAVAKLICAECPVRQQCLEYASAIGDPSGIFGGTTQEERRARRRLTLVEDPS